LVGLKISVGFCRFPPLFSADGEPDVGHGPGIDAHGVWLAADRH
jgi:hypothetical protein